MHMRRSNLNFGVPEYSGPEYLHMCHYPRPYRPTKILRNIDVSEDLPEEPDPLLYSPGQDDGNS